MALWKQKAFFLSMKHSGNKGNLPVCCKHPVCIPVMSYTQILAPTWCRSTRHNRTPPQKPIVFIVSLVLLSFCSLLFYVKCFFLPAMFVPFYLPFRIPECSQFRQKLNNLPIVIFRKFSYFPSICTVRNFVFHFGSMKTVCKAPMVWPIFFGSRGGVFHDSPKLTPTQT